MAENLYNKPEFLRGFMKPERPQVINMSAVKIIKQIEIQFTGKTLYIFFLELWIYIKRYKKYFKLKKQN